MASRGDVVQEPVRGDKGLYEAILFLACLLVAVVPARSQTDGRPGGAEPVFRSPFVLRLHVDNEHYYEETFDRVPYVADGDVYLFAGENFGINIAITDGRVSKVTYQRAPEKADVEFKFAQEKSPDGFMMLLTTRNKLKLRLSFDALMTLPGKKEIYKTTVLPIDPALSSFESWPHPIVQLVLKNFRFSEPGTATRP